MNKVYAPSLFALTLAAAAVTFLPLRLLRPFVPQTGDDVALAYAADRWAPVASGAALTLGVVLCALVLKSVARRGLKAAAVGCVLALAGVAYGARINFFEKMFAPIDEAGFVSVAAAEHVTDEEMVMGVVAGSRAKAYPVTMMAYHHVLNDVVDGEPFVVTY